MCSSFWLREILLTSTLFTVYDTASIAEVVPSLFKQFLDGMRHLMTMVKVAFLLVIELGIFPLMCQCVDSGQMCALYGDAGYINC